MKRPDAAQECAPEDPSVWRDIPGYDGRYQASTAGRIRRVYPSGHVREMRTFKKSGSNVRSGERLFVHLTDANGRSRQEAILKIMVDTFLQRPAGMIPYHLNGHVTDNYVGNIGFARREDLGRRTGHKSKSKKVAKLTPEGEIVEVYRSAREAARKNPYSYQAILDRCNGYRTRNGQRRPLRRLIGDDGFVYAWDDPRAIAKSLRRIRRELEAENGCK